MNIASSFFIPAFFNENIIDNSPMPPGVNLPRLQDLKYSFKIYVYSIFLDKELQIILIFKLENKT